MFKKKTNRDFATKHMGTVYIHALWLSFTGPDTFNDCLRVGEEYDGTRNYTKRGVACQAWSSNTPHTPGSRTLEMF